MHLATFATSDFSFLTLALFTIPPSHRLVQYWYPLIPIHTIFPNGTPIKVNI